MAAAKAGCARGSCVFGKIDLRLRAVERRSAPVLDEYGIAESALDTLIRKPTRPRPASFFTVGEDECLGWTIVPDVGAEAAGVIHSDFVSKFIRAEVGTTTISMPRKAQSPKRRSRSWRLEGKSYVSRTGTFSHPDS